MKNSIVIIAALIVIIISSTNLKAQNKKTEWLNGSWNGIGYQPLALNHDVWNIYLNYDNQNEVITIEYPDFPCSGHWKLVSANKNIAEFVEYIEEGKELCNDQGKIIVTKIDEKYITISYFLPEIFDGVIAFSTMERVIND